jgi:CelD/BcsL family acetyltransferase involved in cellulose biosynthesis
MITAPETPRRRSGSPSVELADDLEPLREDWTRLAEAGRNIFWTWEWSELWWRHYGDERRLRIAVSTDDDEIAALVPLFVWSTRPVRMLRLLGHGHGDRLGPLCAEDDAAPAPRALNRALAAEPHDVFVGDWVAGDPDWTGALGGRVVRTTGYPILDLRDDSWPEFLARQSRRYRKGLHLARNRLERHGVAAFRYAAPETLERPLRGFPAP